MSNRNRRAAPRKAQTHRVILRNQDTNLVVDCVLKDISLRQAPELSCPPIYRSFPFNGRVS
jgi:hypothetical protein